MRIFVRTCGLILLLLVVFSRVGRASASEAPAERVVLLHGFGRSGLSLWQLERFLKQAGYEVINVSYPSTILPLDQLVEEYLPRRLTERLAARGGRVHFVTHSMGGVLLRGYLRRHPPENLGRVVMLAPPNQGSEAADFWNRSRGVRLFAGPNLAALGTNPESGPRAAGPVQFDLGVIAGTKSLPLFSKLLPLEPNDGAVTVVATQVAGMSDFLTLPATHLTVKRDRHALEQTVHFLRHGHFDHCAVAQSN